MGSVFNLIFSFLIALMVPTISYSKTPKAIYMVDKNCNVMPSPNLEKNSKILVGDKAIASCVDSNNKLSCKYHFSNQQGSWGPINFNQKEVKDKIILTDSGGMTVVINPKNRTYSSALIILKDLTEIISVSCYGIISTEDEFQKFLNKK